MQMRLATFSPRRLPGISVALLLAAPLAVAAGQAVPPATPAFWASTQAEFGGRGTMQPGDVLRIGLPRTDLQVTVDGVLLKPAFALGSWLAFKREPDSALGAMVMVMGDLVLTEDEVEPVMKALQQGGVNQTALHNHVLRESPRIMYMHIEGHGPVHGMALVLRSAIARSATPLPTGPAPAAAPPGSIDLDTAAVARALGYSGRVNGGVYQVSVPRAVPITEGGMEIPASMGVATAINFQPTGGGKAAVTGDFVLIASEVNPVIRMLQAKGIAVSAIHSHMLAESPRLLFMHFWANADAVTLAAGLGAALGRTEVRPPAR